jgi:hypothetical protein
MLTGIVFVGCFVLGLPNLVLIAITTFSTGFGFAVGVFAWTAFTQRTGAVNPPTEPPDATPDSN